MSSGPCIDTLEELAGESAILDCRDPAVQIVVYAYEHGMVRPGHKTE